MKCIIIILILSISTSCSREIYTVKKAIKNVKKTESIAEKLFKQFNEETYLVPSQLSSRLNENDIRFLKKKLKCPYVHITYYENNSTFFKADSVVIFTRTGIPIFGKQHNIILDMRKRKRDSIAVKEKYSKYYKVLNGMYYVQDMMPGY
jgi:hypothetical protein